MKKWMILITGLVCGLAYQLSFALELGIHPYKSPQKLQKIYSPLASYLSTQLGEPVRIRIAKDYSSHIDAIGKNELDMAFMGPASYVQLVRKHNYKPLLARLEIKDMPTFQGKIITRQDSGIRKLADIQGKRVAFGDPASTMSHLVPRYMMMEAGVDSKVMASFDFLGSHDDVALAVLAGDYDVGAVKEAVFYKYQARGLAEVATTPALSEHLFVASSNLAEDKVIKIRKALFGLSETENGRIIMKGIKKSMTGMVPVGDSDYDNLREILSTLKKAGVTD